MADGTRPAAVTAAAIIGLIGSVGAGGLALLMMLGAVAMNRPEVQDAMARQPAPLVSPLAIMMLMGVMMLAFALWGCASSIGVLRLKNWGRISFLVYGGLLATFGVLDAIGMAFNAVVFSAMPQNSNLPQGVLAVTMGVMVVFSLALTGIGVWWLIMFNRATVKAAFAAGVDVTRSALRIPVRIAVVAWFFVGSSVLSALVMLIARPKVPAVFLGMEIGGWAAILMLAVQSGVNVVAGVGLLRKRSWAYTLALAVFGFGLINVVAMALRPGGIRGVMQIYQPQAGSPQLPPQFFNSMGTMALVGGLLFSAAVMALLISARSRYLQACAAAGSTS